MLDVLSVRCPASADASRRDLKCLSTFELIKDCSAFHGVQFDDAANNGASNYSGLSVSRTVTTSEGTENVGRILTLSTSIVQPFGCETRTAQTKQVCAFRIIPGRKLH